MKYKNIHQYLDVVLRDIDFPTNAQIKNAKREYWKLWYRHYRRNRRKTHKEFTLSFDTDYMQKIHNKKGVLNTSEFLYKAIDMAVENKEFIVYDKSIFKNNNHQLMQIINQLEELIEEDDTSLNESILQKIERLETQFSKLL